MTPAWPMYRAMVGVAMLCAVAVVGAYEGTRPFIEANEAAAREAAVLRVVPGATRSEAYVEGPDGTLAYAALDEDGAIVGMAFEGRGMGYQDTIELLVGYRPDTGTLSGITVTKSRETPGLGDRIETDVQFLAGFEGRKPGTLEVDTITGATVSSEAVVRIVAEASERWVPRLQAGGER